MIYFEEADPLYYYACIFDFLTSRYQNVHPVSFDHPSDPFRLAV